MRVKLGKNVVVLRPREMAAYMSGSPVDEPDAWPVSSLPGMRSTCSLKPENGAGAVARGVMGAGLVVGYAVTIIALLCGLTVMGCSQVGGI